MPEGARSQMGHEKPCHNSESERVHEEREECNGEVSADREGVRHGRDWRRIHVIHCTRLGRWVLLE